jgi:hypothetical protein
MDHPPCGASSTAPVCNDEHPTTCPHCIVKNALLGERRLRDYFDEYGRYPVRRAPKGKEATCAILALLEFS